MKLKCPYRDVLPPLQKDEFAALRERIKSEGGVADRIIITPDNEVLDGHSRLRIEPNAPVRVLKEAADWSVARRQAFVFRAGTARRNMSDEEIKECGVPIARELNKEKLSDAQIGKLLGVARSTITTWLRRHGNGNHVKHDNVSTLRVKISTKLHPDIAARVNAGEKPKDIAREFKVSVKRIQQIVKAVNKRRQQKANQEQAAASVVEEQKTWAVTDDQAVVPCAAVITDPPYGILDQPWEPKELRAFTVKWLKRWNECKADSFLIFWSQAHMWTGREWFDAALSNYQFQQLLIWNYKNNKSPQSRTGFKQTWEPIFFYRRKGSEREVRIDGTDWGGELHDFDCFEAAVPQGNFNGQDRKEHPAQKPVSVFRWLINATTGQGETVCDPFCGSGTSGIAATQLKRRFHGIEIDPGFLKLAMERIAAYGTQ